MNYNADTEQDIDWSADQLRRAKALEGARQDEPVRRVTQQLHQSACLPIDPAVSRDTTLGNALSALLVHGHDPLECQRLCTDLLMLLAERDRLALHSEFVELNGVETVVTVVKNHGGETAQVALQILVKLSRTSAMQICGADGVEVVIERCDRDTQPPFVQEAALRVLHGLTFEPDAKNLVLRRGAKPLAEAFVEAGPGKDLQHQDIHTIATRLLARLKS